MPALDLDCMTCDYLWVGRDGDIQYDMVCMKTCLDDATLIYSGWRFSPDFCLQAYLCLSLVDATFLITIYFYIKVVM